VLAGLRFRPLKEPTERPFCCAVSNLCLVDPALPESGLPDLPDPRLVVRVDNISPVLSRQRFVGPSGDLRPSRVDEASDSVRSGRPTDARHVIGQARVSHLVFFTVGDVDADSVKGSRLSLAVVDRTPAPFHPANRAIRPPKSEFDAVVTARTDRVGDGLV